VPHLLNAALTSFLAIRKITVGLFGQTLDNIVFGDNVKSAAFIPAQNRSIFFGDKTA
jgi:hypothetical protein